ncbi:MAG TPA: glycosyltransferase family 39 protein [Bryobacteraceae bacterium]|nr:glycosyltransferase family 39 protein [Bryobacteraceae bacterium]
MASKSRQRRGVPGAGNALRPLSAAGAPAGTFVAQPAPAPSAPAAFLERHAPLLAVALVLLATIRIAATYSVFNHVFDEPAHIACGMEWLDQGRYTIEPQHPPLARAAAALGPYLLGIHSQNTPKTVAFSMIIEGLKILYSGNHYDQTLTAARTGILPFFWIACAVIYFWGARYFGRAEAGAAVFLFTFLEPVLAHAGLATTDMALTAFLGAAFLTGCLWVERPTLARAALFGLSAGLAVVSKYSSLVFFPAAAAVALAWFCALEKPKPGQLRAAVARLLPGIGIAAAIVCLVIAAIFRFSWGDSGIAGLKLPAPEFFQGIRDVARHNAEGHPGYLLSRRSNFGFWQFYPVVLAVKTPLAFLFLLALGIPLVVSRRTSWRLGFLPVAYAAGVLGVAVFSHINIGVRHILPVYTGFSLVAGAAVIHLWRIAPQARWAKFALPAALLWFAGTSLAAHPDYLPYFNELAGSHPERILVDSDLDWGQDYKRVAARLRELEAREIAFEEFSTADLEKYHGFPHVLQFDPLQPHYGWNGTGFTMWKERRFGLDESTPLWPDRYEPTERVGKTTYLWYFPPPGSPIPPPRLKGPQ